LDRVSRVKLRLNTYRRRVENNTRLDDSWKTEHLEQITHIDEAIENVEQEYLHNLTRALSALQRNSVSWSLDRFIAYPVRC